MHSVIHNSDALAQFSSLYPSLHNLSCWYFPLSPFWPDRRLFACGKWWRRYCFRTTSDTPNIIHSWHSLNDHKITPDSLYWFELQPKWKWPNIEWSKFTDRKPIHNAKCRKISTLRCIEQKDYCWLEHSTKTCCHFAKFVDLCVL